MCYQVGLKANNKTKITKSVRREEKSAIYGCHGVVAGSANFRDRLATGKTTYHPKKD